MRWSWRAAWRGGRAFLFALLCACDDDVASTVVRLYVYSDVPLDSVRATVLGADAGIPREIQVVPSTPSSEPLFWMAVQRQPESRERDHTTVSFEGRPLQSASSPFVVRQTVRAAFTDKQTSYVRIRLSAACARASMDACSADQTCEASSGDCIPSPVVVPTAPFDEQVDLHWEAAAPRGCGACPYPRCTGDVCAATTTAPSFDDVAMDTQIEYPGLFMRRVLAAGELAAVGIVSDAVGRSIKLFVADDNGRKPGRILASGTVTVLAPPGQTRGSELPVTLVPALDAEAYWVGFEPIGGAVRVNQAHAATGRDEQVGSGPVPDVGSIFKEGALMMPPTESQLPRVYAVFYQ